MTQQIVKIGSAPNDGNGDALRIAMEKVNQNFSELYLQINNLGGGGGIEPVDGNITLAPGTTGSVIVNANTSSNALRVTQIGSGNAFLVEDSENPDTTPFVITSAGSVGIGLTPSEKLHVSGNVIVTNDIKSQTFTSLLTSGSPLLVSSTTMVANLTSQYASALASANTNVTISADQVLISPNATPNVIVVADTGATVTGNVDISGNTNVANLTATGTISTTDIASGTSNIRLLNSGNIVVSSAGSANVLTVASGGVITTGYLTVTGNVNVANIGASGTIVANTIAFGNTNIKLAINSNISLSVGGTANVVVVSTTGTALAGNVTVGNLSTVAGTVTSNTTVTNLVTSGQMANGTSNVRVASNANITLSVAGVPNVVTVNETATAITGNISTTGNANITGYVSATGQLISTLANGTAPLVVTSTTQVANLNVATAGSLINGNSNVQVAANANVTISSVGNANILTVTGTGIVVSGSIKTSAPATKTGDFTVGINENWLVLNGVGVITVTLPSASAYVGRAITLKTITAQPVNSNASNVVPINTDVPGASILDGTDGEWATLVSDGTNWITMAHG